MFETLCNHALHELYATRPKAIAGLTGLALGCLKTGGRRSLLWVRHCMADVEAGEPYLPGVSHYGWNRGQIMLLRAKSDVSALQGALEGTRTSGLGAVLLELWGDARAYDLTASRRLAMAAKTSGVTVLVVRIATQPQPSAAETRWIAEPLPSRALAAHAPGPPRFALTLLRARNGQEGLTYHLEWNRDERRFSVFDENAGAGAAAAAYTATAPLSGSVAAVPAHRPAEERLRRAG